MSIKVNIGPHEAVLHETQKRFNAAATWIASICWDEQITNTNTAHHRVYGQTRSRFGLGSQLAVCARAKAMEAIKGVKVPEAERMARWRTAEARRKRQGKKPVPPPEPAMRPQFGPRASIRYDARTYRLMSLDRVSLSTLEGRVICRLVLGKRHHAMLVDPQWEVGGAELVWWAGTYYLNITQTCEAPPLEEVPETLEGDLGIANIATDSTGQQFTGEQVRTKRSQFVFRRAGLPRVGTRSAQRRLKKLAGGARRYLKNENHRIAKSLVRKAALSRKALALEELTGIREEGTVRRESRNARHCWAFYQLRLFLAYQAAWAGIEVRFVDPTYTSQTCSRCGHCKRANRQSQASFLCQLCGLSMNADLNAAINISRAAVKQPMVATVRR